jgi:predicted RNA-binding Zn-ribbon protein involved in translation (DUF1610 family)
MLLWKLKEMQQGGPVSGDNRQILTHELGAQAYLSGTYYVQGGKVRVTLSCYRLPENTLAFPARSFDRSEKELFALVDDVAREVGRELQGMASTVVASVQVAAEVKPSRELALAFKQEAPRTRAAAKAARDAVPTARKAGDENALAMNQESEARSVEKSQPPPSPETAKKDYGAGPGAGGREAKRQDPNAPPAAAEAPPPAPEAKPRETAITGGAPAKDDLKAMVKSDKESGAAREQAKAPAAARGRAGEDGRRRALAIDEESLAKAWYQNRQALEKYKLGKEDFEALSAVLRGQFQGERGEELRKGLQVAREGLDRVARQGGGLRIHNASIEFACPDCPEASPVFGACPKCGKFMILKVKVEPTVPEKKE